MMLHRARSFLRNLFSRAQMDQRLDVEIEGFAEMLAAEQQAAGASEQESRRRARIAVGGTTQVREAVRDVRAGASLELFVRDATLAARRLMHAPVFTVTTVITIAIGLGATITVLAITDAVLLRPLAYRASHQLVTVLQHGTDPIAPGTYLDWKPALAGVMQIEAAEYWTPTLGDGDPEKVDGLHVTPGLISMLGVQPALGSGFRTDGHGAQEILMSDALWRRRYGSDPAIIGRVIPVGGVPHVVVGVMPAGFQFAPYWATGAQVWAPLTLAGKTTDRTGSSLRLFGRLGAGVNLAGAQEQVDLVTRRFAAGFPESNKDIRVVSLKEKTIGNTRPPLYALSGAVGFVLLIMWVNVAHMLIARAYSRERELSLRVALGASRERLLRETLIESGFLAGAGGLLAIGFAGLSLDLVGTHGPFDLPQLSTLGVDARIATMAAILIGVTALVVAILPASLASATASRPALRHGARGATSGSSRARLRQVLIASEMAFAVVLLVGTLLMLRTFASMRAIDPGFDAAGLVTLQVPVPQSAASPVDRVSYFTAMAERLRAMPGVAGAGFINHLPLAGDEWGVPTFGGVNENGREGDAIRSVYRVITPGLLSTMRIGVEEGRDFTELDRLDRPRVVIVNRKLAKRLWPNQSAVGQRLAFSPAGADRSWLEVVGIVEDVKQSEWTAPASAEVYLPYAQSRSYLEGDNRASSYLTLVARSSDAATVVNAARTIAAAADRARPVTDVSLMTDVVNRMTARTRFLAAVLLGFGLLALTLAAVGIYGVMTYAVAQRKQEIGIRVALGATGRTISGIVVGQAMKIAFVGIAIGLLAALGLTSLVSGQLYGVAPRDPLSLAVAATLLGATAFLATLHPMLVAMRLDPLRAIRGD